MSGLPRNAEALAEQLLSETREELTRADGKASMLLAAFGVFVGVVIAGLLAGEFAPSDLHCGGQWLWWLGCGAIAVSLVALAVAIYPRLEHGEAKGPISYYGHAAGKKADELEKILQVQADGQRSRTVEQLAVVSDIVWRKYRFLQIALWTFGLGSALCIAGALTGS
jgi:MFS family permease